jgi:hypothetical protein
LGYGYYALEKLFWLWNNQDKIPPIVEFFGKLVNAFPKGLISILLRNETQHFAGFVGFRKASTQPTNILNRAVLQLTDLV